MSAVSAAGSEIVILMFQYSVVVKGIEKKLKDMECSVTTVSEELETQVKRFAGRVSLLLFYLPSDLYDDLVKRDKLQRLLSIIEERKQKMLLVGEAKYREDIYRVMPMLQDYTWLDRPVDMKLLEETVNEEISKKIEDLKKHRILIVDDDPAYAKMVREWIKDTYRVDIVTAGMQAITFLAKAEETGKVDLILLDYEMPVVDGPKVLEMLRSEATTAHIPVIFLTGIGTKEAVSRVMSLKPEGYLLKTTTKADILAFLKKKLS